MSDALGGQVVYQGSRRVNSSVAAAFAVLAAASIYKAIHASDTFLLFAGSLLALVAGFILFQAIRRLPRLTLSSKGFMVETGLVSKTISWEECSEFRVKPMLRIGAIEFQRQGKWIGGLMVNQFEASTADLCAAMNDWRMLYGA